MAEIKCKTHYLRSEDKLRQHQLSHTCEESKTKPYHGYIIPLKYIIIC